MSRLFYVVFVSLALVLVPLLESKELISISAVNYPPFQIEKISSDGKKGFSIEIVEKAFKKADENIELKYVPMTRASWSLFDKGSTGLVGTIKWLDSSGKLDLVEAVDLHLIRFVLFYKKSNFPNGVSYSDLGELKEYKIGTVRGSSTVSTLEKKGLNLDYVSDIELNFRKLEAGRVDFVAAVDLAGWDIIKELFPKSTEQFEAVETPFFVANSSLMFKKEDNEVIQSFKKGLKEIVENGEYIDIVRKYYGNEIDVNSVLPDHIKQGIDKK
ncbi:MAG: transporter substrate-binding domain-containing protein [Candidatus Delongbacteria bacterium]|nr:transporter substrate-binding domain-containing protein [Candidatus Delongbacteria bacterium]MBN2835968.1 transporter substrate-binding domain-containing protein [Candidatus Delongbacteria bacterium]